MRARRSRAANAHTRTVAAALTLALTGAACGGDRTRGGTLVISTAGDADVLFPPTAAQAQSREVTDLLFERLAEIGPGLNTVGDVGWTPRLAQRWEWSADSMAVTFHLDARARWHDSTPVRAADIAFTHAIYTDPVVAAGDGRTIAEVVDSMTVVDSLTVKAWFRSRSPERFYALVYNMIPLPAHVLRAVPRDSLRTSAFTRRPVGNGPYRFVRWDPRQRIELAAVEDFYRGRANLDRVIWSIAPQGQTAAQRVFANEADFIGSLTSAEVTEMTNHPDVQPARIGSPFLGYVVFNARDGASDRPHPLFSDRALRRALTMAIDRQAVVTNLLDSLGRVAQGHFTRMQWSADSTLRQIAFDRAAAMRTLDSLGWRAGNDGMRSRGGKPLAFSIIVPTSSSNRVRLATLVQEQLRQAGVRVDVEQLEMAAFQARGSGRRFDATIMVITTSPSPVGVRQAWSTSSISTANSLNVGRYSNPALDVILDSAVTAQSVPDARAHYRRAYQMLLDDAAAIWLFEPVVFAGVNKRVTLGPLRTDAWWSSIPSWRVTGDGPAGDSTARQQ
jgi:peptide/nickel transport system substrate-binding protein